jgi:hypothetical protein
VEKGEDDVPLRKNKKEVEKTLKERYKGIVQ